MFTVCLCVLKFVHCSGTVWLFLVLLLHSQSLAINMVMAKTTKTRPEPELFLLIHIYCFISEKDKKSPKAKRDYTWAEIEIINNIIKFFSPPWYDLPYLRAMCCVFLLMAEDSRNTTVSCVCSTTSGQKTVLWIKSPEQWWWLVNTVCCLETRTATEERCLHYLSLL